MRGKHPQSQLNDPDLRSLRPLKRQSIMPPKRKQFRTHPLFTLLAIIGLPLCVAFLGVGGIGMIVLADPEGTTELANSELGELIKQVTKWNYLTVALFFNLGLIGLVACIAYLTELWSDMNSKPETPAAGPASGVPSATAPTGSKEGEESKKAK